MRIFIIATAAVAALLTSAIVEPSFAGKKTETLSTTTYLGNSDNVADPNQGGNGATTETTTQTGPPGQIQQDRNGGDCHNCTQDTTRDKPGNN